MAHTRIPFTISVSGDSFPKAIFLPADSLQGSSLRSNLTRTRQCYIQGFSQNDWLSAHWTGWLTLFFARYCGSVSTSESRGSYRNGAEQKSAQLLRLSIKTSGVASGV